MMEVRSETDRLVHHAQQLIGIFAAMRAFADSLARDGHAVHYLKIGDPENRHSFAENLTKLCTEYDAVGIEWQEPDSWYVDEELRRLVNSQALEFKVVSTEHFFEDRDSLARFMDGKKTWRMEYWYRYLRKKHDILIDSDEPIGGQWNFDVSNRKAWKGDPEAPDDVRVSHDHSGIWKEICECGIETFGSPHEHDFRWPTNRSESLSLLDVFADSMLENFGDYQDAMSSKHQTLFHSLLSFSLNTKMLSPKEVISAVIKRLKPDNENISSIEGFVRQILGWREFVRGVYWARMPGYIDNNEMRHTANLPKWFWDGQVNMNCLRESIGQSLDTSYAHHIQRLMVIGNFCLLAQIDPKEVHLWYLGVYIDAFEWVESPNTLGMSQFADGGLFASKPYISSSAYIHRMSDYCKDCRYDRKKKHTEDACPFDTLYWSFLDDHRDRFTKNPRMTMMIKNLDRKNQDELNAIRLRASELRGSLDRL